MIHTTKHAWPYAHAFAHKHARAHTHTHTHFSTLVAKALKKAKNLGVNVVVGSGNIEQLLVSSLFSTIIFDLILLIADQLGDDNQLKQPGAGQSLSSCESEVSIDSIASRSCEAKSESRFEEAIVLVAAKLPTSLVDSLHNLSHICPAFALFPAPARPDSLKTEPSSVNSELRNTVVQIFRMAIGLTQRPIFLILENFHLADALSVLILQDLFRVRGLLVALSSRPSQVLEAAAHATAVLSFQRACTEPDSLHLKLMPLSRTDIEQLICATFLEDSENKVESVAHEVIDTVLKRSEGLALFAKGMADLLFELKDELIRTEKGVLDFQTEQTTELAVAMEKLLTFMPGNMASIINSRVLALSPDVQMLLRVCSVAGDGVSEALLQSVATPLLSADSTVEECGRTLCDFDILSVSEGDQLYFFCNSFMRHAIYDRSGVIVFVINLRVNRIHLLNYLLTGCNFLTAA